MGARHGRDSTHSQRRARGGGHRGTRTDDCGLLSDGVAEIIERERRTLQRACALLDCLRIAALYDHEEEIEPGDVAYVVSGLVSSAVTALDRVELRRAARQHPPEPP
jgi:hypothetical protein